MTLPLNRTVKSESDYSVICKPLIDHHLSCDTNFPRACWVPIFLFSQKITKQTNKKVAKVKLYAFFSVHRYASINSCVTFMVISIWPWYLRLKSQKRTQHAIFMTYSWSRHAWKKLFSQFFGLILTFGSRAWMSYFIKFLDICSHVGLSKYQHPVCTD